MSNVLHMKEPVNTWTHFIPFLASIAGLVALVVLSRGQLPKVMTMAIYGASLIVLYGASSLYHWAMTSARRELILKKIDHVSIYVLIAGTYTPVLYFGLHGPWRWTMLSLVWALGVAGIVLKLCFIHAPRYLSTVLYLGLGWLALVPLYQLVHTLAAGALWLLFLGGIFYTVGAVIYATKCCDFFPKRFGFHEIFHLFVVAGSLSHFLMVLLFILPAA